MLLVTVEILPGGGRFGRRTLGTARIWRKGGGPIADYGVEVDEDLFPTLVAELQMYPRWSSSLWDLVIRAVAVALGGVEEMPARPTLPKVPVHETNGFRYVRMSEIPEPSRTYFQHNMARSTRPMVSDDPEPWGCVYVWDWDDFLSGDR
ncbi:hypothetical protein [Cupriavidus sp. CP313]